MGACSFGHAIVASAMRRMSWGCQLRETHCCGPLKSPTATAVVARRLLRFVIDASPASITFPSLKHRQHARGGRKDKAKADLFVAKAG